MFGSSNDPANPGAPLASAEQVILSAIRQFVLPIAFLTIAVAGVAGYMAATETPVYPVRAELLVRIGYEYTPVPSGAGGEYQQVTFRADEVIGTEIQLITSLGNVETALKKVPHPEIHGGIDGSYGAAALQQLQRKLSARRVEGSNVIVVEVSDPDADWAGRYLNALLEVYRSERDRLFGQADYAALLDQREEAAQRSLDALDEERMELSDSVQNAYVFLAATARALSAPTVPETLRDRFRAGVLGLSLLSGRTGTRPETEALLDALSRGQAATESEAEQEDEPAANLPSADTLAASFGALAGHILRLDGIAAEQQDARADLTTARASRLRQVLREETSRNIVVMTPPHQLAKPNGLALALKPVFAGFVAFVLSSLFFVFLVGLRHVTARGRIDD